MSKAVGCGLTILVPLLFAGPVVSACFCVVLEVPQGVLTASRRWRPAVYKGLIPGKSRSRDVIKVLGEPVRKDIPEGDSPKAPEVWYIYLKEGDFPGQFTVAIDKKRDRVLWLELAPDKLTKEAALKHFGDDYVMTRYASCPGDEYIESGPVYESPNGTSVSIEYRSRGIALLIGYQDLVNQIDYVAGPIGLKSLAECRKQKSSRQ